MGRYYSGDIEGKFWFAVQSSDAADRFGVYGTAPNTLEYFYDMDDLPDVEKELQKIKKIIGKDNLKKIDEFFTSNNAYNDKMLEDAGILDIWITHKKDYADYTLGLKIKNCLKRHGSCGFTAEL